MGIGGGEWWGDEGEGVGGGAKSLNVCLLGIQIFQVEGGCRVGVGKPCWREVTFNYFPIHI